MSISNNGVYSLSRDAQDIIAGLKSKLKRTESELARTRELMNSAHDEARQLSAMLDGIGDDLTRRYETALERSEADPGKREHAAAVRAARAALRSYHAIRGTN